MSNPLAEFTLRYGPASGPDGPVRLVQEVFGVEPDPQQQRVLRAFGRGERRISVRSAHGTGKTATAAWIIWNQVLTRFPQKTVATAPGQPQLQGALLPEIKSWGQQLPQDLRDLFEFKAQGIYLRAAPHDSFFEARTSRQDNPEALQGVHSEHVLLVADEASGVPEAVFEAAYGSMSGHNATTLLIGNPVRTSGLFFDTHHKDSDMWFTAHFSAFDCPRITPDFFEEGRRRYGENSNAYRIRCLGEFPKSSDDTVIPFEAIEAARYRDIVEREDTPRLWGLDVARFGGDRSALVERTNRFATVLDVWQGADLMETAARVKQRFDETQPHKRPRTVLVDVIGMGGGVVDRLRELGLPARGINVGEAAALNDRFDRARSELWWRAREWLERRDVRLDRADDDRDSPIELLVTELAAPTFKYTVTGKILVEPKNEVKKRLATRQSPDIADAFVLTFAEEIMTAAFGAAGLSWDAPLIRGVAELV